MLRTSNLFARSDTGVVIDSKPHPSLTCKTSFLFAPFAVRVHTGCSAFPFYTPNKRGGVAQLVMCLAIDVCLTADPGVVNLITV